MTSSRFVGLAPVLACVLAAGCGGGEPCETTYEVVVLDTSTDARVCDATVTATFPDATTETLTPTGGATDCVYRLLTMDDEVMIDLSASKTGYRAMTVSGIGIGCNVSRSMPTEVRLMPM